MGFPKIAIPFPSLDIPLVFEYDYSKRKDVIPMEITVGMKGMADTCVEREDTGNDKCDDAGRIVTPTVQSFRITL